MKKIFTLLIAIAAIAFSSHAQNTWIQKADVVGDSRIWGTGFSIHKKGYLGLGSNSGGTTLKDIWEYDQETDTWTQKADFGGDARQGATSFSILNKGYIGTGRSFPNYYTDFWEFDPTLNTWTQKADFGGGVRAQAVGFSIGIKGHIGTGNYYIGYDDQYNYKDFWEYDPDLDTWTQKSDFGGVERGYAVGFSIGNKGYIGTGFVDPGNIKYKDFWEYDPDTDTWTQKANVGGAARYSAVGFTIGDKGYVGTGLAASYKKDFWEYDPGSDSWTQKANVGGDSRTAAIGLSIGNKGYIGTGADPYFKDFWEYTPDFGVGISPIDKDSVSLFVFPSPAENFAIIQFTIMNSSHVNVSVYNVSGREIFTLLNDQLQRGEHSIQLNTSEFAKGVYLVKMICDEGIENRKLMVQ